MMKIIKEFTTYDGRIVRVAKTNNEKLSKENVRIRICDIKYVNRTINDDFIKQLYIGYVNAINRKNEIRKGKLIKIASYDRYKQLIIDDYMLRGIQYEDDNTKKLEEHK